MLCLFCRNGKIKTLENEAEGKLIFIVFPEKKRIHLDGENHQKTEEEYDYLAKMYKQMHLLFLTSTMINDSSINEIVKSYDTLYKNITLFDWIKTAYNEAKNKAGGLI